MTRLLTLLLHEDLAVYIRLGELTVTSKIRLVCVGVLVGGRGGTHRRLVTLPGQRGNVAEGELTPGSCLKFNGRAPLKYMINV